MKKILAICGAVAMLSLNTISAGAEKVGESYFADDFENQTNWESIAAKGWGSNNGGAVSVTEGKDGKCAMINAYWGSSLNAPVPQNLSGVVGISFDMTMNKRSVDGVYFRKGENAPLDYLLNFQWRNNVYEIYSYGADIYNTSPIYTLSQDQWVNVQMFLDLDNAQYSVTLTDSQGNAQNIINDVSLPIDNTLDNIVFFNPQYGLYGVAEDQVGTFCLDNFDMYKEVPSEAENFENADSVANASGWKTNNSNGAYIKSENGNKFLEINSLWENTVTKTFREPSDKNIVIDMRLNAEQPKGQFLRVLTGTGDNDYVNFLCLNQDETGENQAIYCYGENVWNVAPVTFENGKWFNLKIIVNNDRKVWYGYINTDPDNGGEDQLIFSDSITGLDKIYGLQFYYPLHWNPNDDTATGKYFRIDDFDVSSFDGEISYTMAAEIETADGKKVADKQELLKEKDQSPVVKMTVTRTTYGEMLPTYAVAAIYENGKLVDADIDSSFNISGMNTKKTVTLNPDFSKLSADAEKVEVKTFLWQANDLVPLTDLTDALAK